MKVNREVRDKYDLLTESYSLLLEEINPILIRISNKNNWFLKSRLKKLESFALKLESDTRYGKNDRYEDFLGFEVVVNTRNEVEKAISEITSSNFSIEYKRPDKLDETKQSPEDFRFNELRLYLKRKTPQGTKTKNTHSLLFEIQIKTMLSHAWGRATHDIIYKSDHFSWGKSRVAFQIKAILEQAEFAISQIDLTDENYYPRNKQFSDKNEIIEWLQEKWPGRLPDNLKRLSELINSLCNELNISLDDLKNDLEIEASKDRGYKLMNLSPYLAILQSLFHTRPNNFLKLRDKPRISFINVSSLNIPEDIKKHLDSKNLLKSL